MSESDPLLKKSYILHITYYFKKKLYITLLRYSLHKVTRYFTRYFTPYFTRRAAPPNRQITQTAEGASFCGGSLI